MLKQDIVLNQDSLLREIPFLLLPSAVPNNNPVHFSFSQNLSGIALAFFKGKVEIRPCNV